MLIGYARVSTTDQNPQLQLNALRESGCEIVYEETASGARNDREQLRLALSSLKSGDCLVVWKLDRLARSLAKLIDVIDDLNFRNVGFKSITESIDTMTPGGRLTFHVFGALAEFERSMIRERTLAGLEAARRMGRVGGRPRALKPEDLHIARTLLADSRISASEVATQLKISLATLYRYLPAAKSFQTFGTIQEPEPVCRYPTEVE